MHPAYPYYASPMHYAPSEDPRAKEISSHMKMDPSTLNSRYQPWPYGGSYCYPVPQGYHGCSNHGYFGGPYSFQPPYPHYPPPPPLFYPPFPGAYPAYSVPPSHYSVEQPRYDYDKHTHGSHHCCGCNRREEEKKSRIEREEPEVDKKTNDSLVPSLMKDYPYPIMWVPSGFTNTDSKAKEREKSSHDPVSLKPLEPSKRGGNDETESDQQGGDDNRLPFPIFWFPSKKGEDIKEKNLDLVPQKGSLFSGSDDKKRQTKNNDEGSGSEAESEMGSKHVVRKVIPVKQLGTEEEKKTPKSIESKVQKTDNGMEGKASSKTSKLPPVCLRIDPLPRRKNGSRSPSPPGDKGRSKGSPIDSSKSSQQQTQLLEGLKKSKEEQSKGDIKTIEETNDANKVEKDGVAGPCENVPRGEGNESEKGIQGREPCKAEKKNLSEHEAALIIQSVYRGFEVWKSKPIMKLRQISGIQKQVAELRNRIWDLESSSSSICIDDKQKLVIGETIMSLLLKLDTIQGLHPTVRDIRKSVAKELVGLQEKLDSLTLRKSETPSEDTTIMHPEDDAIQEKPDQEQAHSYSNVELVESGMGLCENCEVEPTESQDDGDAEARNTNLEMQNEQSTGELNDNQLQVLVETNRAQSDSNSEFGDTTSGSEGVMHPDDANQEKPDQEQDQLDSNLEVQPTESQDDGGAEAWNINLEQQVELQNEENTGGLNDNQVDDVIQDSGENHEIGGTDCEDDGGIEVDDMKKPVEGHMSVESEQPVDDAIQEKPESGTYVETGVSEVESAEAPDINLASKSQQEVTYNQVEMEEEKSDSVKGIQEDMDVLTEEAPKGDDVESPTEMMLMPLPLPLPVPGGDERKLMEENEKLRGAVEELMKAGKEQVGVIRELTGRVKDLEKKLSKQRRRRRRKRKINKCRSGGRIGIVEEEVRSCIV